ncbi:MAG: PAS domain S-box protein [Deltaproteobacteria bacterium]|nr:PAS domain S-box protein [Deltaproteobacteria bacterium]
MTEQIQTLIVEDSRLDAKILQGLMAKSTVYDFDALVVTSGEDARTRVSESVFDLMLLDLGLPDSAGVNTLDKLATLMEKIPVIVLTGDDDIDLATKALQNGAQDYLVKGSIDLPTIEKTVRYALERHKLRIQRDANLLSLQEAQQRTNRMLAALDKSNQKLEDEIAKSRLLTTAIEQSVESVVITDVDGIIMYANKSFENVTGYSVAEALGKNPRILKSGLHDETFYAALWRQLTTTGIWTGRIKNKKKDGSIFEEDARISAVRDENGTVTNYVAVKKDITHEAALELQLMQARKLESIGQLAAGIAHEINTPSQYVGDNIRFLQEATEGFLTVLNKYEEISKEMCPEFKAGELYESLQSAKEEVDLEFLVEEAPSAISQSLDGIQRITKIVLAMKEFSHPGTEQMTVNDINKAIQSIITVASNEWKYVAAVETNLQDGLPMVPCFMGEMNQVFLNIIVNAAHAIGEAQVDAGKICIRTVLENQHVRVDISDNGTGIPESIRNKIFDPFFTTKEVGKGTGQGLAMAFSTVVDKHRGQLLVDSKMGEGTTFSILLPLSQPEEGSPNAQ